MSAVPTMQMFKGYYLCIDRGCRVTNVPKVWYWLNKAGIPGTARWVDMEVALSLEEGKAVGVMTQ